MLETQSKAQKDLDFSLVFNEKLSKILPCIGWAR